MMRILFVAYGALSYVIFLATFLYSVGFVGNFGVPKGVDTGADKSTFAAVLVDLSLLAVFALQHSIMARPAFKRWWTRIIPSAIERSTYVLASSLALILLYWQWRPLPQTIWEIANPFGRVLIWSIFWLGWCLALVATFLINHFDLFGLRQVYLFATSQPQVTLRFQTPWLYRYVRHPLLAGFVIASWATPSMTRGHLLFAAVSTLYILAAIQLEERDLLHYHGQDYAPYRRQVRMLLPIPKSSNAHQSEVP
jgi:methanethiol S-methyltransferase